MGLSHIYENHPDIDGVITFDADGQHLMKDAFKLIKTYEEDPNNLILGVRVFDESVPLRSKVGNLLTRRLFGWLTGLYVSDTQTGMRLIPRQHIPSILKVRSNRMDFAVDFLMVCQQAHVPIKECEIATVYLEGNASSTFRPVVDSLKIYWVLFRFGIIALLSSLVDYAVFIFVIALVLHNILFAMACSRIVAGVFNYFLVKKYAFYSFDAHRYAGPKYALLALLSGGAAYLLILCFMALFGIHVVFAKIVAEVIIFFFNFVVQRTLVFRKSVH